MNEDELCRIIGSRLMEAGLTFDEAEKNGDPKAVARCLAFADTCMEQLSTVPHVKSPEARKLQIILWNLRGKARVLDSYLNANPDQLAEGLDDLRRAEREAPEFLDEEQVVEMQGDLARGLLRMGEESSEMKHYREAAGRALKAMDCDNFDQLRASDYRLFNLYSVANLRIGVLNADPGLVEKTARQLRQFLGRDDLCQDGKVLTRKNVITALLDFARLQKGRKKGVYEDLCEKVSYYIGEGLPDQEFYLHHRGTARLELAEITGNMVLLKSGAEDIEALLDLPGMPLHHRLTAMQSLAQIHFRLGKYGGSDDDLKKAVSYYEGILETVSVSSGNKNTMTPRLLQGIASAKHVLGKRNLDPTILSEAEASYRDALSMVDVEASPWLYARIALGLFLTLFHQARWQAATEIFFQLEHAWEVVVLDRKATSDIHRQRSFEMSGHYARAAFCHLQLGEHWRAFGLIDSNRAQSRRLLSNHANNFSQLKDRVLRAKLEAAEDRWKDAQNSGDGEECRFRLRQYLDLLREAGLDGDLNSMGKEEILDRLPQGGAFVMIFSAAQWVRALLVEERTQEISEVVLPDDACEQIGIFLRGHEPIGQIGWQDRYQQYAQSSDDCVEAFRDWSECVEESRRVLGSSLMDPIHDALKQAGFKHDAPIVLLPPGELAALPMASALLKDGSAFSDHWLVSSLPAVRHMRRAPRDDEGGLLLVTMDEARWSDEDLPFAEQEADWLVARFPDRSRVLKGNSAGLELVLRHINQSEVIHFSCHGRYDWEEAQNSRIILPDGSPLYLAALHPTGRSNLSARLVTLSCCETGISGVSMPADEFDGLLPAFLHCGAQAALGTLWAVLDDAAMLVMRRFYEKFLGPDGKERCLPSEALAQAQRWLRQVTVSELVEEGYLSREQAFTLVDERFGNVRLRRIDESGERGKPPAEQGDGKPRNTLGLKGSLRLYSSPVDWAAFVLVGF